MLLVPVLMLPLPLMPPPALKVSVRLLGTATVSSMTMSPEPLVSAPG